LNKPKVIHIIPEFGLAGAEIMAETLMIELSKRDYNVKAISMYTYDTAITKRLNEANIPVFFLGKKNGLDIRMILKLYKIFRNEKPDIIHTHRYVMQYAIPAAVLAGVPVKVHTVHNIATKELGKLQRRLSKIFYKVFNVIPVAISPIVKESIKKEYGIPHNKIPMVYNGIDFARCSVKKIYNESDNSLTILHVGRFAPQKNHFDLINGFYDVAKKYPSVKLKLIGIGELEGKIKSLVNSLELSKQVEFLGSQNNVYEYMNNADIFILPSLWEGMPITIIEAMGTGVPIIASNVGGIPDMLENNKNALIIEPNSESITNALIKFISDNELRKRCAIQAKTDAMKIFSADNMCKNYEKIYFENLKSI